MSATPEAAAPPKSPFATSWRTHTCGELRRANEGKEVTLCGAVDRILEGKSFEVRDGYGRTLVRLPPLVAEAVQAQLEAPLPALETVVKVSGKVLLRRPPDAANPTGEVLLEAGAFRALSPAKAPLLYDFRADDLPRADRIRHRYLYLRKPAVHEVFAFRTRVLAAVRRFLAARAFDEVETPILGNRWTPEAVESFLAIRERGAIFALPGARTLYGPLLMASGFDRTFEIARRFRRKKSYGPFQQPEFSVLEIMMAFVGEAGLLKLETEVFAEAAKAAAVELGAMKELPFEEAELRYGSDCPDLRFGLEIQDLSKLMAMTRLPDIRALGATGGIRGLLVPSAEAARLPEDLAPFEKLGEGGPASLHWIRGRGDEAPVVSPEAPIDQWFARDLLRGLEAKAGDLALVTISKSRGAASRLAGAARVRLARVLGLGEGKHALVRVTRLPFFRFDAATGGWALRGDPLSRPVEAEIEGDPHRMHGLAHYVVLDGVNVGGGSIRNHDLTLQRRLFGLLGLGPGEVDQRFAQLLDALRFGVPPFGRIAIGVDRLVALLRGLSSIDEVIPLPKTSEGVDPLARSPWPIDAGVVRGLFGL